MPPLKERLTSAVERVRARYPFVDHVINTVTHYGAVNGNAQSGCGHLLRLLVLLPDPRARLLLRRPARPVLSRPARRHRDGDREPAARCHRARRGRDPDVDVRGLRRHRRADRSGRCALLRPRLAVGDAAGARGHVRDAQARAAQLRRRQAPRPRRAGPDRADARRVGGCSRDSVAGFSERILGWLGVDPGSPLPFAGLWLHRARPGCGGLHGPAARPCSGCSRNRTCRAVRWSRGAARRAGLRAPQVPGELPDRADQGASPRSRRSEWH